MQRRRAQVRLAQQAYRQRKEATVALLEQQVRDLRGSLEKVQVAFDQFQRFANSRDCVRDDVELSSRFDHAARQINGVIAKSSGSLEGDIDIGAKITGSLINLIFWIYIDIP